MREKGYVVRLSGVSFKISNLVPDRHEETEVTTPEVTIGPLLTRTRIRSKVTDERTW